MQRCILDIRLEVFCASMKKRIGPLFCPSVLVVEFLARRLCFPRSVWRLAFSSPVSRLNVRPICLAPFLLVEVLTILLPNLLLELVGAYFCLDADCMGFDSGSLARYVSCSSWRSAAVVACLPIGFGDVSRCLERRLLCRALVTLFR